MIDIGFRKNEFIFIVFINYIGFLFMPFLVNLLLKLRPGFEPITNIIGYITVIVISVNTMLFIVMYFRKDMWKFKDEPLIKCSDCRRDLGM